MATKRVIAYFMHEVEEAAATASLRNPVRTESYVIGELDETRIGELQRAGLVVQELPPPGPAETPGRALDVAPGLRRGPRMATRGGPAAPLPADAPPPAGPAYFLVQLRGPLVEEWRADLGRMGVTLLEHVPRDSYKALL